MGDRLENIDDLFKAKYENQDSGMPDASLWDKLEADLDNVQVSSSNDPGLSNGLKGAKSFLGNIPLVSSLVVGVVTVSSMAYYLGISNREKTEFPNSENQIAMVEISDDSIDNGQLPVEHKKHMVEFGEEPISNSKTDEAGKISDVASLGANVSDKATELDQEVPNQLKTISNNTSVWTDKSDLSTTNESKTGGMQVLTMNEDVPSSAKPIIEDKESISSKLDLDNSSYNLPTQAEQVSDEYNISEPVLNDDAGNTNVRNSLEFMEVNFPRYTAIYDSTLVLEPMPQSNYANSNKFIQNLLSGFNISLGVNASPVFSNADTKDTEYSFYPRVSLGYSHKVFDKLKIETNLGYTKTTNHKLIISEEFFNFLTLTQVTKTNTIKSIDQLDVDLGLRYIVYGKHSIYGGVNVTAILQATSDLEEETDAGFFYSYTKKEVKGTNEGLQDYSVGMLLSYQFRLSNAFNVNLNYRQGFNDISIDDVLGNSKKDRLQSYEIMIKYFLFR
ncbi:MAG: hypothetical protein CL840_20920 [Crocinitomicaceae bacterium]|nr:hypothetical protein [Crocinitomicaceae bacterium]|tara:strand:- start:3900 stop:5405 length:1506 start_codon:yes stop_codon:yes gene_type:complete